MDFEELASYIQNLPIDVKPPAVVATQPRLRRLDADPSANSAAVDDGSVVSFVAGVSAQHQQDVLDSTLLAQLNADAQFDRTTATDDWYGAYTKVLGKVGWVIQDFTFEKFTSAGLTLEVNQAVLQILSKLASGDEMAVITDSLAALQAMGDTDQPLSIFDQQSSSASGGNFQISVATETNNLVAMKLGAFFFTTSESTNRFLWFTYISDRISVFQSSQVVTLNEDVYGLVREVVIAKLGTNAQNFIADLQI